MRMAPWVFRVNTIDRNSTNSASGKHLSPSHKSVQELESSFVSVTGGGVGSADLASPFMFDHLPGMGGGFVIMARRFATGRSGSHFVGRDGGLANGRAKTFGSSVVGGIACSVIFSLKYCWASLAFKLQSIPASAYKPFGVEDF